MGEEIWKLKISFQTGFTFDITTLVSNFLLAIWMRMYGSDFLLIKSAAASPRASCTWTVTTHADRGNDDEDGIDATRNVGLCGLSSSNSISWFMMGVVAIPCSEAKSLRVYDTTRVEILIPKPVANDTISDNTCRGTSTLPPIETSLESVSTLSSPSALEVSTLRDRSRFIDAYCIFRVFPVSPESSSPPQWESRRGGRLSELFR
mmetsp:Transcript_21515/g.35312  ORF Transcript_21515/g.35312 Transcript_21515/m.35312 type:complete len:205 (+) Transcript_21515:2320-2934(+)